MKTKMVVVALITVTAGVFSITHMKKAPPSDLRDAVADFTDIKVSDIKAGSSSDIPMPAPTTNPASASEKEGAAAYAKISVDERIPAGTSDIVKATLIGAAEKITALSPDISIMFMYHLHNPNNPQISFLAPNARRVIFLHEAKQLRYEWAPAQKKPLLFFGQKAHPDTMDIREQVEAVLDCAAFLAKGMSKK